MRVLFLGILISMVMSLSTFAQTDLLQQYFKEGNEFAKDKKYDKAIESYNSSWKMSKNNKKLQSKIQYNIGTCLYQLGKFKDAENAFYKAIELSKDEYIQAIYSLGLTQIELEKLNLAKTNFQKVLRLDEKHAEAWFDLGMVFLEQKKLQNAKIAFEKSIEFKTTRLAEAENNLGVIAALEGNVETAVTQFQKAFNQSKGKLFLAKENLDFWREFNRLNFEKMLAVN